MTAFQGTPGPWHIEVFESEPDRPFICASWGQEDPVVNDISEVGNTWANARLIAAAPDLLAALQALLEEAWPEDARTDPNFAPEEGATMSGPVRGEVVLDCLAAIAKALGEVPA